MFWCLKPLSTFILIMSNLCQWIMRWVEYNEMKEENKNPENAVGYTI